MSELIQILFYPVLYSCTGCALTLSFSILRSSRHLNTSSLLCDCQLKWFPLWVAENAFLSLGNASCAHPQPLKAKSVFAVSQDEFVCGEQVPGAHFPSMLYLTKHEVVFLLSWWKIHNGRNFVMDYFQQLIQLMKNTDFSSFEQCSLLNIHFCSALIIHSKQFSLSPL